MFFSLREKRIKKNKFIFFVEKIVHQTLFNPSLKSTLQMYREILVKWCYCTSLWQQQVAWPLCRYFCLLQLPFMYVSQRHILDCFWDREICVGRHWIISINDYREHWQHWPEQSLNISWLNCSYPFLGLNPNVRLNLFENWSPIRSLITLQTEYLFFQDVPYSSEILGVFVNEIVPYIRLSNWQLSASWLLNPLMDLADGTNKAPCWSINQSEWIQLTRKTAGTHCIRLEADKVPKKDYRSLIKTTLS